MSLIVKVAGGGRTCSLFSSSLSDNSLTMKFDSFKCSVSNRLSTAADALNLPRFAFIEEFDANLN